MQYTTDKGNHETVKRLIAPKTFPVPRLATTDFLELIWLKTLGCRLKAEAQFGAVVWAYINVQRALHGSMRNEYVADLRSRCSTLKAAQKPITLWCY